MTPKTDIVTSAASDSQKDFIAQVAKLAEYVSPQS